jgi:geranylgeranylglycerol-phosphate geranylgeranyltransferase
MPADSGGGRAGACLKLARPGNCAMASLGALLASIACGGPEALSEFTVEIVVSMATVAAFTAAGNSLNDYFDRDVDRLAHPDRPIPRGLLSPSTALTISAVLFALALGLSMFVSPWSLIIVITSVGVMVGYEVVLKAEGFAGNLAISWLTGALFLFGGAAVDRLGLAAILAALAFLATLGREVIKDVQDVEGDRRTRRTLPMRIGQRNAGLVAAGALGTAVVLSPAPYLLDLLSVWYVPVVAAADAIFIYCALIQFEKPEKGQKAAKLAMIVALIAFLAGGVT